MKPNTHEVVRPETVVKLALSIPAFLALRDTILGHGQLGGAFTPIKAAHDDLLKAGLA